MLKRLFVILLLPLLLPSTAHAQISKALTDTLSKHLEYYRAKRSNTLLFAHLDKTVYVNNEMMWFTAYLMGSDFTDIPKHQVLAVALVNNNDQTVAAQGKFVMGGGLAYGNLSIPDSIPPGHYSFLAYTNYLINGKPQAYFIQAITLKTVTQPTFNVELTLDTLYKDPANVRVMVQANAKNAPQDGASINYFLGKDAKTRLAGKAKTNVIGSYTLLVPKDHISMAQHNLEVQVKYGTDVKTLHLNIPLKKQVTDVKFYPEGGHLITGLPNRVGWEAKTTGGTPIKTMALLYAGKDVIDTIGTDSYGMGIFNIIPLANITYTIKLLNDPGSEPIYALPVALNAGVVIHIPNAIIKDSLKLQLLNTDKAKYTLLVHNYRQVYLASSVDTSPEGRGIKIDLSTVPRGLQTITLLDSLNRPCAERLFFAHYDQKPGLSITVDNKEPGTRQKVNIKLKLNGINKKPLQGVVSVACVQDNRFEIANDNNIEHYVYLQSELESLPLKEDLMGSTEVDRHYLNELMLVRGWTKYKWPELMNSSTLDTLKKPDSLMFTGTVQHFGSALKKPAPLIMMRDTGGILMMTSTDKGLFTLNNGDIYTRPDKKTRLIVSGKSDEYNIKVNDPYPDFNKNLAKAIEPTLFEEPIVQNTGNLVLKGLEHATNLREVKIKATNNSFIHPFGGANANACGDYVCTYRILNCPNHRNDPGNHAPQAGEMVYIPGQGLTAYSGCSGGQLQEGMLAFTTIYTAKEFYGADYTVINPTEVDYLSTICWKYGIRVNSQNEAEVSFYTSDITGKFRIVAQGLTSTDVVYGEESFVVKKKGP